MPNKPVKDDRADYRGLLAETMRVPGLLSTPEEKGNWVVDQAIKTAVLFQYFGIDLNAANAWRDLAMALARKHVPGFGPPPVPRGHPKEGSEAGGDSRRAPDRDLPGWLPQSAGAAFTALFRIPGMNPDLTAMLERLATRSEMREAWARLPAEETGTIANMAMLACSTALSIQPDSAVAKHRYRHSDPLTNAQITKMLIERLALSNAREWWLDFAPYEPRITFNELLELLETVARLFEHILAQRDSIARALMLPPLPRKRGRSAPRVAFSAIMSYAFVKRCGTPLDTVVATFENVAFDLAVDHLATAETIRSRRRQPRRRPVHSSKKSQ
jgi:hypothetical protein